MNQEHVQQIVTRIIREYGEQNNISIPKELTRTTPLIGSGSILDSMGLVNVIVDIETALLDAGEEVSLTSEVAMSGRISPFRSVGSLCNYITDLLKEKT